LDGDPRGLTKHISDRTLCLVSLRETAGWRNVSVSSTRFWAFNKERRVFPYVRPHSRNRSEPEKKQELIYALNQEIVPILKEQPGFVETLGFLPENKSDRILSITFWTEKRFAEKYAKEAYPKVEQIMNPSWRFR
jgi:hypothetical protein